MNKKSMLKVFLSDQPEFPRKLNHFDSLDNGQRVIYNSEELVMEDAKIISHHFYGKDVTMRLSTCFSSAKKLLYSIPAEPVVTFHIQVIHAHYAKFANSATRSLWIENQSSLFWQNDETLVYDLPEGTSSHFDLFFRPNQFLEMAYRHPILREMAREIKTAKNGNLDFFVAMTDDHMDHFSEEILEELDSHKVNSQRFLHLCECFLLRCMGIDVVVEPLPTASLKQENYS